MLLIIDNGSRLIDDFCKTLKSWKVEYKVYFHFEKIDVKKEKNVKCLILGGGSGNPYGPLNLRADFTALRNFNVPTIGICLGHEIIAIAFGGSIKMLPKPQNKVKKIFIDKEDPIFEKLGKEIYIEQGHEFYVSRLPKDFLVLAHSKTCNIEVMRHKFKPIYGFQGHPEDSNPKIMKNFLKLCKIL